ncbi:MAG: hypothetical protein Q7J48_01270 [Nocardioides sp.]|nr:hypothetical protein [Nocardioides sp.]
MNGAGEGRALRLVLSRPSTTEPDRSVQDADQPPAAAALDEVLRMRMTVLAEQYLGDTPALDAHLALLDTRGAWYAERILTHWNTAQPDAFWGLVNYYVRTHLTEPDQLAAPAILDLPAWVAAGPPPAGRLRRRWEEVADRIPAQVLDRLTDQRGRPSREQVETIDTLVDEWPEEHWIRFLHAYAVVEAVLADFDITLPILGD